MKPKTIKLKHVSGEELYSVKIKREIHFSETHFDKARTETELEDSFYALGKLEDIEDYYKLKYPDKVVEVKKVELDYNLQAMVITSELGKKSRELRNLEKKVREESENL